MLFVSSLHNNKTDFPLPGFLFPILYNRMFGTDNGYGLAERNSSKYFSFRLSGIYYFIDFKRFEINQPTNVIVMFVLVTCLKAKDVRS